MRYILAPSSLAGRGLGVGFLYLITSGSAVILTARDTTADKVIGLDARLMII